MKTQPDLDSLCLFGFVVYKLLVDFKGRKLYRMVVFSPWAFGGMIVALVFSYMFTGQTGVINDLLVKSGLINERIAWLATGSRARAVLIFTTTWRGIPFFAVSFLAALQSIPNVTMRRPMWTAQAPLPVYAHYHAAD